MNLKYISWNVNGIRAMMKKGFDDLMKQFDADFVCLQETKIQEGQYDHVFEGYHQFYNYAEKKGYSGTAIFARRQPLAVTLGIGVAEHDREGRVLTLEYPEFYLVTVYTPNSQDQLARLPYRVEWELAFADYVAALDKSKPVIICGDLNVAHQEIDLRNPNGNETCPGFSPQERSAFSALLSRGFVDTYRALHPEGRDYSWWSYRYGARRQNIGWRIDYFLVSQRLLPKVVSASILTKTMGSDHAPVELTLQEPLEQPGS